MSTQNFLLPDVGEGLTGADIVSWRVKVGDTVEINDVLVEVETEKSLVELPSPFAGVVAELLVAEGDTVAVGTPIVAVTDPAAEPTPTVLVGYGPSESATKRRAKRTPSPAIPPGPGVRTKPPVRKLAKDLGVRLDEVAEATGEQLVTREHVVNHVRPAPAAAVGETRAGEIREAVRGVRKATASAMVASAFTAPHVTEFLTVDVTRSVKLVDRLRRDSAFDGARVTILLLAARALLAAMREYPDINASWDDKTEEIVRYQQVNLGIAAATPRGLLVPNIKDAGSLTLPGLAKSLTELVDTARTGATTPADMSRGTVTITNVGVFGVDTATPILNPGEAAILCLGAVRRLPWEHKGKVALRHTTQLALSFDHRLVDGELGSRVLARVGAILENPRWELLLS
ncbi:dihydrolipoamide acetyltransferase family protein [Pseudonocardia spinosispora]|uniref:dihydrolipoamide acetyltransferase family protein n=1 Tax=Pseudonocardia spinosispora TaxID=103441 RepID=UPI000407A63B|nr:dihydrolipoamide acetyltransferase family protein [Pseudonocardia spinosispora]